MRDNNPGVTRRDFLNGVAIAIGSSTLGGCAWQPHGTSATPYPPAQLSLVGQMDGSENALHMLRDSTHQPDAKQPDIGAARATGEHYDLLVVGAGISGLTAAHLYRKHAGASARILLLDSMNDIGGHAKRNEFVTHTGETLIGYGGSQSLQTPSFFSPLSQEVLTDVGIDLNRFKSHYYDQQWHAKRGLGKAIVFHQAEFGADRWVKVTAKAADWVPATPLSDGAKHDLIALLDAPQDYLPGKTAAEKRDVLAHTTYDRFLTEICGYHAQLCQLFHRQTLDYLGVGTDTCSALDAFALGLPGFDAMNLGEAPDKRMSPSARLVFTDPDDYIYHFPDGNAGLARGLLRQLIPHAVPGTTMDELALLPVSYRQLDRADSAVRLRLNASVVSLQHRGHPDTADAVDVLYQKNGELKQVSAARVILACWHRVIPLLTDELPAEQIRALQDQHKVPLIYANVLLRHWKAFEQLGVSSIELPGHFWSRIELDFPVSVANYTFPQSAEEPMIVHLSKVLVAGERGTAPREQSRLGRHALTAYRFADLEREIREALTSALSAGGFDADRDIEAITINRWAHGYAYEYMYPWDTYWPDGELPINVARRPWGRVAIANADSGAYAYANSAMDQAARAIHELFPDMSLPRFADFPGPPEHQPISP